MNKTILVLLALAIVFFAVGCVEGQNEPELDTDVTVDERDADWYEADDTVSDSDAASGYAWKDFLKEYEDWVDEYIVLIKKYSSNPTDMSVLSDYTEMLSEMTDWEEKLEEVEKEMENASAKELTEYTSELTRIATKLANAAY